MPGFVDAPLVSQGVEHVCLVPLGIYNVAACLSGPQLSSATLLLMYDNASDDDVNPKSS